MFSAHWYVRHFSGNSAGSEPRAESWEDGEWRAVASFVLRPRILVMVVLLKVLPCTFLVMRFKTRFSRTPRNETDITILFTSNIDKIKMCIYKSLWIIKNVSTTKICTIFTTRKLENSSLVSAAQVVSLLTFRRSGALTGNQFR